MDGLEPVFEEKLGAGIAEAGGFDHRADRAKDGAVAFAKKKAGGFHFAGLRFDVSPIWSLIQFWNDA